MRKVDVKAMLAAGMTANLQARHKDLERLLARPGYQWAEVEPVGCEALRPAKAAYGVYHFFAIGDDGGVTSIYVGESHTVTNDSGLHKRIRQHFNPGGPNTGKLPENLVRAGTADNREKAVAIIRTQFTLQYLVLDTPAEALALEHYAIAVLMPRYNFVTAPPRQPKALL